jgi:uncharacterized membrane protein
MARKTIVAVYDTHQDAKAATEALLNQGFSNQEVSLVASDAKREYYKEDTAAEHAETAAGRAGQWAINGGLWGGVAGLVAGLVGMTLPGVGPVVVAGPLGAMLGGAITGALVGGLLGGLTSLGIPEEEAHVYAESLRRGGTLVSVTVPEERVELATATLDRYNPVDIDERSATWKKEGWSRFDEGAGGYTAPANPVVTGAGLPTAGVLAGGSVARPLRPRAYGYPESNV